MVEDGADNVELFNTLVGLVFDQLYRSFPIPARLDTDMIAKGMDVVGYATSDTIMPGQTIVSDWGMLSQTSFWHIYKGSLDWLEAESFIREVEHEEWVLTASALSALNSRPASLSAPIGKRLADVATQAGTEAGRAAISELVGQLIGSAARGFLG